MMGAIEPIIDDIATHSMSSVRERTRENYTTTTIQKGNGNIYNKREERGERL